MRIFGDGVTCPGVSAYKAIELARAELRAALDEAVSLATIPARFGSKAAEIAALLRELDSVTDVQEA